MVKWKRITALTESKVMALQEQEVGVKGTRKESGKNKWKMSLAEFVRRTENQLLI